MFLKGVQRVEREEQRSTQSGKRRTKKYKEWKEKNKEVAGIRPTVLEGRENKKVDVPKI